MQGDTEAAFAAEHSPGILRGGFGADPGEFAAAGIEIEHDGLDAHARRRRIERGEQRRLERQQVAAIGGGAFGKQGEHRVTGDGGTQRVDLFADAKAIAA